MNVRRSWLYFFIMLVIAGCIVMLAAKKPILKSIDALRGQPDGCDWQCVGAGNGKFAAAAGWQDDELVLCRFSTDGTKKDIQHLNLPESCMDGMICRLLPVSDDLTFLALYGKNADKLYLFRITGGNVDCLLDVDCEGDSFMERTARTRFSELSFGNGVMCFAFWTDQTLKCYICRESGGLEPVGKETTMEDGVLSVLTFDDGSVLRGGAESIILNNKAATAPLDGQTVTHLAQGTGGWYYIDAVDFELYFVDADLDENFRILPLRAVLNGKGRVLTSVAITREESVLMLFDGTTLCVSDAAGTRELEGVLRASTVRQYLSLVGFAGIALAGAILLWLLFCGLRRGYAPLAILRGSLIVAGALLCITVLRLIVLEPAEKNAAKREQEAAVQAVLKAEDAEQRWNDNNLAADVARMLEGAGCGENVCVVRTELTEDIWRTADGRNAVTLEGFSSILANASRAGGFYDQLRGDVFRFIVTHDTHSLSIRMNSPDKIENKTLWIFILGGFGLLTLLALIILAFLSVDLRKISKTIERISQGNGSKPLKLRTGDELESMASVVNSFGAAIKKQEADRENMEKAYRRFVPEKVLALLDKPSILDVDKSDFAARRMAIGSVCFTFPDALYTDMTDSRFLFDSVNEIIERTSAIVARKNGIAFHFAYNGFEFVMDDSGEAVSTAIAIQQEVLSFNESRAQELLPGVTLRIAIDRGNFMLGIVGDASTMTPTTISSSLAVVQELTRLCGKLKAGILCTEVILSAHQDYGSRYMGKCLVGGQPVRVYEVFDGDDFNTRRGKAGSIDIFARGVYDLYSGDTAGAKHTFLQLAHNYPNDGGARYYLHLTDRLEHNPSLPCVLNFDYTEGGEM
jgi:hypothetical protein